MALLKMAAVAWRLAWPYLLTPWQSPLLRWRLATYGIKDAEGRLLDAEQIDAAAFFRFLRSNFSALIRFLHWAATL